MSRFITRSCDSTMISHQQENDDPRKRLYDAAQPSDRMVDNGVSIKKSGEGGRDESTVDPTRKN